MKRTFTILLLIAGLSASAQKLPSKVTVTLTWQQFLSIDSALGTAYTWQDSKSQTAAVVKRFEPFYIQVNKQIADSAKIKKP